MRDGSFPHPWYECIGFSLKGFWSVWSTVWPYHRHRILQSHVQSMYIAAYVQSLRWSQYSKFWPLSFSLFYYILTSQMVLTLKCVKFTLTLYNTILHIKQFGKEEEYLAVWEQQVAGNSDDVSNFPSKFYTQSVVPTQPLWYEDMLYTCQTSGVPCSLKQQLHAWAWS